MELKQTISCTCRVSAVYEEDGALSVKVFAQAPYDGAKTTTAESTTPIELQAELRAVMDKILEQAKGALGEKIGDAIHVSRQAAKALGELQRS